MSAIDWFMGVAGVYALACLYVGIRHAIAARPAHHVVQFTGSRRDPAIKTGKPG